MIVFSAKPKHFLNYLFTITLE